MEILVHVRNDGKSVQASDATKKWVAALAWWHVPRALSRLAENTDASMLIVGGQRPGCAAAMTRMLEGSVSVSLTRSQTRPIVAHPGA